MRAPLNAFLFVALASISVLATPQDVDAARSSKPKEIVVVGSKVKDVVRNAGLLSDDRLVQALSNDVRQLVAKAAMRAARNRRKTLKFHDIDCWSQASHEELLIIPEAIGRLMARGGFSGDRDSMLALSDKVHEIIGDAIVRARGNDRLTVRPYDL
jgi:histone H3/H4